MLSYIVDGQPPVVCDLFHYALTILMFKEGKAEVIERHIFDLLEHLPPRTSAGDVIVITKPDVSQELLAKLKTDLNNPN